MMDVQSLFLVFLTIIAIGFILWRFMGGAYGSLRLNREVGEGFENFQVQDNMNYYISGPDAYPNVIMGVDKTWTLCSDLWKKKALTPASMKELVLCMHEKNMPLHGFEIVDQNGRKIGHWFSVLDVHIMIKVLGENKIVVSTPPSDTDRLSSFA
jgi:hypothetical protein